ncbi:hypothetical protein [Rhodoblastus sp.]|jgi:hypothetical protein|uniref:hypothetical protein n=1 Tax=Rhodoblastus sp. TaxID=1962975 RepID=UPI0026154CE3|nr:hypothetical protein [Rhodoblastus sp.]
MIVKAGFAAVIVACLTSPVLANDETADQRDAAHLAHCRSVAHSEMAYESCVSGREANPNGWSAITPKISASRQASE